MNDDLKKLSKAELIEEVLRLRAAESSAASAQILLHELSTYQEEVKVQNTQLREAQQQLEESRDRYADLFDFAPLPYLSLNMSGIIKDLNLTAAQLLQAERARLLHLPLVQFIDGGDRRRFLNFLRESRTATEARFLEVRLRAGGATAVRLILRRIAESDGATTEFRVAAIDITQQQQAEEAIRTLNAALEERVRQRTIELESANRALECEIVERRIAEAAARASEQQFRQLANAIPQIVWIVDAAGKLRFLNERWFELTGNSGESSYLAGAWEKAVHPDDIDRIRDAWQHSLITSEPLELEYRLYDAADRQFHWQLARAVPIRDSQGEIVRWFGTSTDVGPLKESQDLLRETSRKKDEFLAMLAHELRNPLSACSTAVALLQMVETDSPDMIAARDIIGRQLHAMTRMIDDLLDMSRVARGKIELKREPADLADIVRHAAEVVRGFAETRQHQLWISVPDFGVVVDVDSTRIEQVLVNLLNNALKYTPPGGNIDLSLAAQPGHAVVTVADNGEGMHPDFLPRAFELFAQAERSPDRPQGGLGIGLTMVKSLIDMHGGSITAESAGLGCGSRFVFRLPWEGLTRLPTKRDDLNLLTGRREGYPQRVLVVDDNPDVSEALHLLLKQLGFEAHVARDGNQALEQLQRLQAQVVLLDIGLPGMDGYEVARHIRQQYAGPQPLLVAVTGYGTSDDRRRALEAGFDAHLTKPVSSRKLLGVIQRAYLQSSS